MHRTGQVNRPPTEADVPLLEVTYGCSWNKCTFCTMYHKTEFGASPLCDIEEDLRELKQKYPDGIKRIFLINGDTFTLPYTKLVRIGELIHKYFPEIECISCYASILSLKYKTLSQLEELRNLNFNDFYIGIESASDYVLELMNKGYTSEDVYECLEKLQEVNMQYNALIMLGAGGVEHSEEHVQKMIKLLNTFKPHIFSPLSTTVEECSLLYDYVESGRFNMLTERQMVEEELCFLENVDFDDDSYFFGNHMYYLIPASGYFKHKDFIIDFIREEVERLEDEKPGLLDSKFNTFPKKHGGFLML